MSKTTEEQINGLLHIAEENIKDAYNKGYKDGLKDGNINDGTFAAKIKEAYNNGLNDAEKAIKRVLNEPSRGGLYANELQEIFGAKGIVAVLLTYPVSEIIEKIREYDDEKAERNASPDNEIHIGDEVYAHDKNVKKIVLGITDFGNFAVLSQNGNFGVFSKGELHKTGKTYPVAELIMELDKFGKGKE